MKKVRAKSARRTAEMNSHPQKNARKVAAAAPDEFTAERFIARMKALQSPAELAKITRYFKTGEGEYVVTMEGVDIYDPITNTINATRADKVAAWFLDSDYDGSTFCISQAFFPDSSAWEKLAKAWKSVVDPARFEAFSGTHSLPFAAGKHRRCAVKVIDPRGNEVMRVLHMGGQVVYGE